MQAWPRLLWVSTTRPRGFQESQLKVILDSCQTVYSVFLELQSGRGRGERQCESRKSMKGSEERRHNKGEKGGRGKARSGEADRHRKARGRGRTGQGCGQRLSTWPSPGLGTLQPVTSFSQDTLSHYKTEAAGALMTGTPSPCGRSEPLGGHLAAPFTLFL